MSRTYSNRWCYVCGRDISAAGLAWYNHCMKHVREGKMIRTTVEYEGRGYFDFKHVEGVKLISPPKWIPYRNTKKQEQDALRKIHGGAQ